MSTYWPCKSHASFVISNTSHYIVSETRVYDSCVAHVSPLLPTCHSHRVHTTAGRVAVRQSWSSLWRPRTIPWTSRSSWKNWRYLLMVDKMVWNWRGGELHVWKRWTSPKWREILWQSYAHPPPCHRKRVWRLLRSSWLCRLSSNDLSRAHRGWGLYCLCLLWSITCLSDIPYSEKIGEVFNLAIWQSWGKSPN